MWIYLTNSSDCSPLGLERMDYDVLYSNHRESFGKRTSECLPINLAGHNVRRKKREKVKSLDGKFGVRLWIVCERFEFESSGIIVVFFLPWIFSNLINFIVNLFQLVICRTRKEEGKGFGQKLGWKVWSKIVI